MKNDLGNFELFDIDEDETVQPEDTELFEDELDELEALDDLDLENPPDDSLEDEEAGSEG